MSWKLFLFLGWSIDNIKAQQYNAWLKKSRAILDDILAIGLAQNKASYLKAAYTIFKK